MDNTSNLVMISVEKLFPHPDNPRKELGNLDELTESIKSRGIMQNLTVIPRGYTEKEEYTVVIGHRRLAAAKRAGLKVVPCVVTHMTEKETLATMLLENMQRSDLTVFEQAQGFQLMIDLGESVSNIADKTGFSESTVRRRVKLATLDQDTLKKVSGRQISFKDLDKLFEVESESKRNELLNDIGTSNFNNRVKNVLNEEKVKREEKALRQILSDKGIKEIKWGERYGGKYEQVGHIYTPAKASDVDDIIAKGASHYNFGYGACYLYKPAVKKTSEEIDAAKERADKINARRAALEVAFKRAYELRREFIETAAIKSGDMIKLFAFIMSYAAEHRFEDFDPDVACSILKANVMGGGARATLDALSSYARGSVRGYERCTAVFWYLLLGDSHSQKLYDYWRLTYDDDAEADLHFIYEYLEILGYEISDEEKQLLDGTHELYVKEGEQI